MTNAWPLGGEGEFRNRFVVCLKDNERGEMAYCHIMNVAKARFHGRIEVRPSGGKEWDVFRLMNFLSYMPDCFVSKPVKATKTAGYDRVMKVLERDVHILSIFVTDQLESMNVYATASTAWFKWHSGCIFSVEKREWDLEKPLQHPLRVFGRFFGRRDRSPCAIVNAAFKNVFAHRRVNSCADSPADAFYRLASSLPGYVEIVSQKEGELSKDRSVIRTRNSTVLQRFTWACPWARDRIRRTHYIELDGSFRLMAPYTYCCVNTICNNESVTIALSLGVAENTELYESAYKAIESFGVTAEELNHLPVLSDMGSALRSFCNLRNLRQFLCHRHIIERYGNPVLRRWVIRLLECVKQENYEPVAAQILCELRIWASNHPSIEEDPKL